MGINGVSGLYALSKAISLDELGLQDSLCFNDKNIVLIPLYPLIALISVRMVSLSFHFLNELEVICKIIERTRFRVMRKFDRCPTRWRVSVEEFDGAVKCGDF